MTSPAGSGSTRAVSSPASSQAATFATSIARARARAVQSNVVELRTAARGGQLIQRTVETTENRDGSITTKTTERHAGPDWRANAWWLERQDPAEFSAVERREISGPDGGPIEARLSLGELYRRDPAARKLALELADRYVTLDVFEGERLEKRHHLRALPEGPEC